MSFLEGFASSLSSHLDSYTKARMAKKMEEENRKNTPHGMPQVFVGDDGQLLSQKVNIDGDPIGQPKPASNYQKQQYELEKRKEAMQEEDRSLQRALGAEQLSALQRGRLQDEAAVPYTEAVRDFDLKQREADVLRTRAATGALNRPPTPPASRQPTLGVNQQADAAILESELAANYPNAFRAVLSPLLSSITDPVARYVELRKIAADQGALQEAEEEMAARNAPPGNNATRVTGAAGNNNYLGGMRYNQNYQPVR